MGTKGQDPKPSGQDPQPVQGGQDPSTAALPSGSAEADNQALSPGVHEAELRRARKQVAELRQRLKEYEAKVAQYEAAQKTETERYRDRVAELERAVAEAERQRQELLIRSSVINAAYRLGAVDPDAVFRLIDLSKVDFDEDGNPIGVEEAVKELLAARPYLRAVSQASQTSPTNPPRQATLTPEQIRAMSVEEINRRWDEVRQALRAQRAQT